MDYQIISLDVDGTLLNDQGNLPVANQSALLKAQVQGAHIILNTGKPISTLESLINQLDIHDPVITLTGGLIAQRDAQNQWETIKRYPIPTHSLQLLFSIFQDIPMALFVLSENRNIIYINRFDTVFNEYLRTILQRTSFQPVELFDHPPLMDPEVLAQPIEKVMVISDNEESINALYAQMRTAKIPGIEFHISAFATIDIHAVETSKKIALQYIADQLGVPSTQVLALGDNETDLDVVRWAGFGAIMANGPHSVKIQAPHIAPGNQEAGVAHIINKFLLKE
jgi:Cof subfamily protein (haloacid dehalogenase superfamily)